MMCSTEGISSKALLLGLPNELLFEVASHLYVFKDLNSLVRTSRFFHEMFNPQLYRRAVAAKQNIVRDNVVARVLLGCRLASLTLLLDHGLSVNHIGQFPGDLGDETMLRFLCSRYDTGPRTPLARLLIQRGADIEAKDSIASATLLHTAAKYNNCGIAALLLTHQNSPDVNAADKYGRTPLHYASKHGREIIELLIAHGAAVDSRDDIGRTPLHWAIHGRNYELVPTLLAHGADGGSRNNFGETLLHRHASAWFENSSQHHKVAKLLLEHGALVNATDEGGLTPLHWVWINRPAWNNGFTMAKFLLENGADVNAISNRGLSPLQYALSASQYDRGAMVALLLEHGADVSGLSKEERRYCHGLCGP
jgi:ankyrin repeat protein